MTLNAVLLFAAANLAALALLRTHRLADPEPGPLRYGAETLAALYPGRPPAEVRALLRETWDLQYRYEPFTQFREGAARGRYVNVTPAGFRAGGRPAPWPPSGDARSVFVFGGSTTFGYGLADGETIPAALADQLDADPACRGRVVVYNFGRSNYFSSQERALFERLLIAGHRPDAAVFVDGLNEFGYPEDEPKFSARLRYLMAESDAQLGRRALTSLPLARLAKAWLERAARARPAARGSPGEEAGRIVSRWLRNREIVGAVAAARGVASLFVWQPVPVFGYDLSAHPLWDGEGDMLEDQARIVAGYAAIDGLRRGGDPRLSAPEFLWLADIQRGRHERLYVDRVHYTAEMSREIAGLIRPWVAERLCAGVPAGGAPPEDAPETRP
jgi:lysophospholipase L1-like esterase